MIEGNDQSKNLESVRALYLKLGAEDGIQIEPLLNINRLNYTLFFPNLEETNLLAFQLKQLKDHLELKGYAYLR